MFRSPSSSSIGEAFFDLEGDAPVTPRVSVEVGESAGLGAIRGATLAGSVGRIPSPPPADLHLTFDVEGDLVDVEFAPGPGGLGVHNLGVVGPKARDWQPRAAARAPRQTMAGPTHGSYNRAILRDSVGHTTPPAQPTELHASLRALLANPDTLELAAGACDADVEELFNAIIEVNGQDAYSNETAALGKLSQKEWLVLPEDMRIPVIEPGDVGSGAIFPQFPMLFLASVYTLNKAAAPDGVDKVRFATLRMEAVKMGWYKNQREVDFKKTPADALDVFKADKAAIMACLADARRAAFIVPMAAEHVFRTFGHHYITAAAADYAAKYLATFRACLHPEIATYLPHGVLYHTALHWVSPERVWEVLTAQKEGDRVPEAIKIRMSAAPAGVAVITTSAAVITMMEACNVAAPIEAAGGVKLEKIVEFTKEVRTDPPKYHKVPTAYGRRRLTDVEQAELEVVRIEAIKFAPVAQGFIEGLMREAALGKAKALMKHADENPVLRERSRRFFARLGRVRAENVDELFKAVLGEGGPGKGSTA